VIDPVEPAVEEDDPETIRLLRLAGPRASVSGDRAARVRSAVRAEWQAGTHRRLARRRVAIGATLAAAVTLAVFAGRSLLDSRGSPNVAAGVRVATVERIEGRLIGASSERTRRALQSNDAIRVGEWIQTDAGSRVALRFDVGTSIRLDAGTRLRPLSPGAIELVAGAVYVDTGREHGSFEVRTALAVARDLGTQFEVRLIGGTLRLRVRTGEVELRDQARSLSGRAGTEITWSARSAASRPVETHGAEWQWTTGLAPALEMEGQSLAAFLERAACEQGWTVEYADAALASRAGGIVLHGSVTGLAPHDAIAVAIASSGLTHRIERGVVAVTEPGETAGRRAEARR
jgi:hypothetical protein